MSGVIVFDVNETLLDLSALEPFFARVFGDRQVLRTWFLQVLQYSLVSTIAGPYFEFGKIAGGVLEMMATAKSIEITPADRSELAERMQNLPPHPEVLASLQRLKSQGIRMATLSNSAASAIPKQLGNAGLAEFFEQNALSGIGEAV